MKRRYILGLIFACALWLADSAQAQFSCVPREVGSPSGTGSRVVEKSTPLGDWRYIWCPASQAKTPDGYPVLWRIERHVTLAKYRNSSWASGLSWAALTSGDPLTIINAAVNTATILPANAQEKYERDTLLYEACQDAYAKPYLVDIIPPSATPCGPAPVVPSPVWLVAPNGIYPTRPMWAPPDGVKAVSERAIVGLSCDCSAPVQKGTQALCRVKSSASVNLTACAKQ
jgi:hypothetical protein